MFFDGDVKHSMCASGSAVAVTDPVSELAPIVTGASMRCRTPSSATQIESCTDRICTSVAQLLAAIGALPAGGESLPDDATLRHPLRSSCRSQGLTEIWNANPRMRMELTR